MNDVSRALTLYAVSLPSQRGVPAPGETDGPTTTVAAGTTVVGTNTVVAATCLVAAIEGGITAFQLREKGLDDASYAELASRLLPLTRSRGIPLIVNDSIEAALRSGADGAHIGQTDGSVAEARLRLPRPLILGVSANTVKTAQEAERDGADYIGVGAMFPTYTKDDAEAVSIDTLREIAEAVSIPVVAIGGITEENALRLSGSGIAGIAVVSALFGSPSAPLPADGVRGRARALLPLALMIKEDRR